MHSKLILFPRYTGDGIGEHYVNREYKDRDGNVVLDVDTMYASVNTTDASP